MRIKEFIKKKRKKTAKSGDTDCYPTSQEAELHMTASSKISLLSEFQVIPGLGMLVRSLSRRSK